MRIGRLRHRVTLLAPAEPRDQTDAGAYEPVYGNVATVWAEVRTLSGSEQPVTVLETTVASTMHRVQIRMPSGWFPRADWRVVWGERTFEVTAVLEPDNRARLLVLECVEVE